MSPHRDFTVQFSNWTFAYGDFKQNFQIILYEGGRIQLNYLDAMFRATARHETYAGIENATGKKGLAFNPWNETLDTTDTVLKIQSNNNEFKDTIRLTDKTVIFTAKGATVEPVKPEAPEPELPPEPELDESNPEIDIEGVKALLEQAESLIKQAMTKLIVG